MKFKSGVDIEPTTNPLGFKYGTDVFGPFVENRHLNDIRKSLLNPNCEGPDIVYAIAMDVGKKEHFELLKNMHLLFGVVTYAAGKLGKEPVRSQGHIHKISPLSGWSTPEVYEIWSGKAIIYMQETAHDDPGRCFAVKAEPGDVVIVPPSWAHATISADPQQPLTFGAWCDREFGYEYDEVRSHKGLAWYPVINEFGEIEWLPNANYQYRELQIKTSCDYSCLGIEKGKSIYTQFEENPSKFSFVPFPARIWEEFIP